MPVPPYRAIADRRLTERLLSANAVSGVTMAAANAGSALYSKCIVPAKPYGFTIAMSRADVEPILDEGAALKVITAGGAGRVKARTVSTRPELPLQ